ncbi:lipase family protein [Candidatus Spongiihabitans sp.]|uniref:lipase family protein n=1 Tax=Candidatus Spongiihabitans sp. TaxID=3101308 RepID=UPI003C6EDF0B
MANILTKSQAELDRVNGLLNKNLPSYRQAYSDRTAWLMACLSELAYIRFNPLLPHGKHVDWFRIKALEILGADKKSSLTTLIDMFAYDHDEEKKQLEKELTKLKIELVKTFDNNGTQAILISSSGKFITLAFRGTEKTEMKDIKTDANVATTLCESGGKIHSGFNVAFDEVALDIQEALNEPDFSDLPLFITGHSLGGALATIATKKLSHNGGIAACYTFGSPRVGNDVWVESIKSPIFRVVNAADCVTMLPLAGSIIRAIAWVLRMIAKMQIPLLSLVCDTGAQKLSLKFGGYLHCGDMRYLTNCPKGNYANVKLLPAVSFFYRIKTFKHKIFMRKFLADHSISIYRKKLMVIATRRNP